MDRILRPSGVEVVDFAFKLECCGAAFGVPKKEMVLQPHGESPFHGARRRGELHSRGLPAVPAEPRPAPGTGEQGARRVIQSSRSSTSRR